MFSLWNKNTHCCLALTKPIGYVHVFIRVTNTSLHLLPCYGSSYLSAFTTSLLVSSAAVSLMEQAPKSVSGFPSVFHLILPCQLTHWRASLKSVPKIPGPSDAERDATAVSLLTPGLARWQRHSTSDSFALTPSSWSKLSVSETASIKGKPRIMYFNRRELVCQSEQGMRSTQLRHGWSASCHAAQVKSQTAQMPDVTCNWESKGLVAGQCS